MDDELMDATVRWLSALLDSATVQEIGVSNWWSRAKTALETAAASADTYSQAVSVAARKLQIDTLRQASSAQLLGPGSTEDVISPRLDEWRLLAQRDAVYIVGLVQIQRAARRGKVSPVDLDAQEAML
ncbi:hypothetical protein [Mycobacterium ostraviense]|uniref:Uncharacterized protein n=1 Tax=Mycobacterium ostraviense TaxID=2738409 RepID=A0A164B4N3_9MYCO|nr:hypothetical protein [Mycobacterium ostraviense]KZS63115.1 hypothetical protein A4G28_04590 [Mycobacterium ostraviense]